MTDSEVVPHDQPTDIHPTDNPKTGGQRQNRVMFFIAIAGLITVGLVVVVAILAFLTIPAIASDTTDTTAFRKSQDIQGCRTLASANRANAETNFLISIGDAINAPRTGTPGPTVAEIDQATAELKIAANVYRNKVLESQTSPDQFLSECHQAGG